MTAGAVNRPLRAWAVGLPVAAAWAVPIVLSAVSGQATAHGRLLGNLASLLFAPLFVLLAVAIGDWLLDRVFGFRTGLAGRRVFAAGIGLGALSLGTLGVGLMAVPPAAASWAAMVVLALLLSARTGRLLLAVCDRAGEWAAERDWVELAVELALVGLIAVLVALNVLRAFVPPVEYDEMEYHLAAPAEYVRRGQIFFLSNNAYSNFPANVEMLFLDAMVMRGGVVEGFALGRLINVALGLLAAVGAGACASAVFGRRGAVPAAAVVYTWPAVNNLSHVGYVELGLMLYAVLALLAAHEWAKAAVGRWRHAALLGAVCGLAAGCKYPAVLFVCVPAAIWVLAASGRGLLRHAALFGAVALAVFSPWLVRNAVNTGNPVYPLLGRVFDGRTWSERKDARWQKAHGPKGSATAALWTAATEREPAGTGPVTMSVLLVAFVPLAFVRREWRKKAAVLLVLVALCVGAWLFTTHRITRFVVPWLIPLAVVSGAGAAAFGRWRVVHALLGCLLVVLAGVEAYGTVRIRAPSEEALLFSGRISVDKAVADLKAGSTYSHEAVLFVNSLPAGSRTLFYGEAETLYCTGDVVAPTVFDENPLDEVLRTARSAEEALARLRALRVTHVYVNLAELHRLQWSYAFEYAGRPWPGYCTMTDAAQLGMLGEMLIRHARPVYPAVSEQMWRDAVSAHGSEMDPRPVGGERWGEYLSRAVVQTMRTWERDRPPRTAAPFVVYELLSGHQERNATAGNGGSGVR